MCEELVDALSLMVALAADATLGDVPAAHASVESDAVPAVSAEPPPAPARLEPPAPKAPARAADPLPTREQEPRPHLVGLAAFVLLNAAPDTLLGLAINYEQALEPVLSLRLDARAAQANSRANETFSGVAPALFGTMNVADATATTTTSATTLSDTPM